MIEKRGGTGGGSGGGGASFATTQWSLVLASREPGSAGGEALDRLCRVYWPPLFAYARRDGLSVHDAQDAVQGFLGLLLARRDLAGLSPERGRFRSYLLKAFKHYLISRERHESAAKRGGGVPVVTLEPRVLGDGEGEEPLDDASPDRAFDRAWAQRVLERALERLGAEHRSPSQARLFEALRFTLLEGDRVRAAAEVAGSLGMSPGALATAATRLRQRFRALIEEEVAQTLMDPGDLRSEMETLWSAWS